MTANTDRAISPPPGYSVVLDEAGVMDIMPHRGRWLLNKAVLEKGGEKFGAFKVTDEACDGHFPGNPIVPAVLLWEFAAQFGGVDFALRHGCTIHQAVMGTPKPGPIKGVVRPGELILARIVGVVTEKVSKRVGTVFNGRLQLFRGLDGDVISNVLVSGAVQI